MAPQSLPFFEERGESGIERAVKRLCFARPRNAAREISPASGLATPRGSGPATAAALQAWSDVATESRAPLEPLDPLTPAGSNSQIGAAPDTSAPRSLDELGPDLMLHVLRLAKPTAWDLCRFACVSKSWRQLSHSRVFWTKLRISTGSIRPGVEALAARCQAVTELHIDDPRCELFVLHPLVLACSNSLQRVVINCDRDTTCRNEAAICSILWIISLHCKKVETVELLSVGQHGGFNYIDNKALWYLTTGFRHIRSFASLCQESVTKQSLYLMVIAWRDLACLRIHCGKLALEDLLCLRKCAALRVLELAGGDLGLLLESATGETGRGALLRPGGGEQIHHPALEASAGAALNAQRIPPPQVVHPELEVLVLSNTAACPAHLVAFLASFPGLKRLLLNRGAWASGMGEGEDLHRRKCQIGAMQRWLLAEKGVELLLEE